MALDKQDERVNFAYKFKIKQISLYIYILYYDI